MGILLPTFIKPKLNMRKTKKEWTKEDVLYLLEQFKIKIAYVDWTEIHKHIAEELNTTVSSVGATLKNCQYIATGNGLENYSKAQVEATELFIRRHTAHFFKLV